MSAPARRIGILAGGGTLPLEFARSAARRGELARIVALDGAADADFGALPVTVAGMGQIGRMLAAFRAAGVTDIVIIGPAKRPDLKRIRPDLGFFRNLRAILQILASGGDDGVLSGVVRFFEAQGFRVIGPADVAPETLAEDGVICGGSLTASDETDIAIGYEVIRALGDLDVGQAAIICDRGVEAIEAAEGTDRMLERVARARAAAGGSAEAQRRGGVLVKRPKPGQELRVDTPSIGPGSILGAAAAGLSGIAVLPGGVLIADRDEVMRRAQASGIFLAGVADCGAGATAANRAISRPAPGAGLQRVGRFPHGEAESKDIRLALTVAERLKPHGCGGCVAASRGHVLAVEAGGEGARAAIDRVGEVRRAGRGGGSSRRSGSVVVAAGQVLDMALIEAADAARLSAVVVGHANGSIPRSVVEACDRRRLVLLRTGDPALEAA